MTRTRVCAAGALFLLGVLVISSVAFSQTVPTNWAVRYLNLKDNLRALAIDPLDPKVVFIGSNLAVIGTTDGGETWTTGESFRTSSFSVTGGVSDEVLEILRMAETTDEGSAAAAADLEAEPEIVDEEAAEVEETLGEMEEETVSAMETADELESELSAAMEDQEEIDEASAESDALAGWEPDDLSIGEVSESTDAEELEEWLEERNLPVPEDISAMQDTLIDYLSDHEAEGALEAADSGATAEIDEVAEQVAALEEEHEAVVEAAEEAEEELSAAEEEAEVVIGETAEVKESAEEEGISEEEEETVDLEATGVNYLVFDPAASEKIYLAAFDGVYRSEDTGSSWEKIYTGPNPPQSAVLCLAVDPSNPDALFAGTLSGLARSADGGKTWDRPAGRIANMVISRIAVHPFDSRIVLAGTAGYGIFKSTDGGGEWTQVLTRAGAGANRVLAIEFAPSQPEVIYAGTMSGIYKSLDGGESWDPATGMGISPTVVVRDLVVSPINPEQVVIAADQGVFGTENGGGLWRKLAFGTIFSGSRFLTFDPLNPATVWLMTSSRVFKSAASSFLDLSDGEEKTLSAGGEITVDGRERHTISIEEINEETGVVTVTVQSEPRTVQLKVGEATAVDLTGDGQDDLNLSLESLDGGVPLFRLTRIAPSAIGDEAKLAELIPPDQVTCLDDLEPYFRAEPTWVEVQQAAARWAEVHPEKIASWRAGAAFRALLPRVRVDFQNRDNRREDYELQEQSSYSRDYQETNKESAGDNTQETVQFQTAYTFVGGPNPDLYELYRKDNEIFSTEDGWEDKYRLTEGEGSRNRDTTTYRGQDRKSWGLQLRWELGDFLYSNDQRLISAEVRKLVELRQDVVEQVTLYYFDRRTARIDMILNPPADPFSRVEMLLQIQQLDASLDAMTGGYFTQTIKNRERQCRP